MNAFAGQGETPASSPFVTASGIRKTYGGVQALKGVSLSIEPGEAHGLVGANGAGKSTLIRILAGLTQPDDGDILVDGERIVADNPHVANKLGMSFIHQELAFVPGMTVLENIMLGVPKKTRFGIVDWRQIARDVEPTARRVGVSAPLDANVKQLSTAENWLISITRALIRKARLIVMDEPTAALSAVESERLFAIIRDLRQSGVAVLYVSHRLDEILELCQGVTVPRRKLGRRTRRRRAHAPTVGKGDRRRRNRDVARESGLTSGWRGRAFRARALPLAESPRRQLRLEAGRSARPWRSRRRRPQRTGPSLVRRGPARLRGHDLGEKAFCASQSRGRGQCRVRLRAGGAPRRGSRAHQEPRLQSLAREPQFDRLWPIHAARERAPAQGAGRGRRPRPRDQDRGRRYSGRTAQWRQSAKSRDWALAAIAAQGAHSR